MSIFQYAYHALFHSPSRAVLVTSPDMKKFLFLLRPTAQIEDGGVSFAAGQARA